MSRPLAELREAKKGYPPGLLATLDQSYSRFQEDSIEIEVEGLAGREAMAALILRTCKRLAVAHRKSCGGDCGTAEHIEATGGSLATILLWGDV